MTQVIEYLWIAGLTSFRWVALAVLSSVFPIYMNGQTLTVLVDRTGSIGDQADLERALVKALTRRAFSWDGIDLVFVGEHVFEVQPIRLRWATPPNMHLLFHSLEDALKRRIQNEAVVKLETAFSVRTPPSKSTCVSDFLIRAAIEAKPVLLISDLKNDSCPLVSPAEADQQLGITVVIVRSRSDRSNDASVFQARERLCRSYLRNAQVFPQFRLEEAVEQIASPVSQKN